MTYRTTREAYGQQLSREAFEQHDPDRPVIIVSILAAGALAVLWGAGLLRDQFTLIDAQNLAAHNCSIVDTLAGDRDTMLWTCRDGYRVSSVKIVDGL